MAAFGHVVVGIAGARVFMQGDGVHTAFWRACVALATLSLAPDLDVLGFRLGVPYEAPFGHRGATHSLLGALAFGGLCAALPGRGGASRLRTFLVAWVVVTTHGLLDALTDGGRGVAILWPFSSTRYFSPWTPIPVAPLGFHMFSFRGAYVIGWELLIFSPLLLWGLWPTLRARWRR
jgi:inner membrane protein